MRTDWWAMPLLAGALLAGGVGARSGAPRTVFVNCETGDDAAGDGSRARPFLTPMRARNFVRGVHPFAREPVEVQVYGDCYPRNAQGNVDFSRAVLELEPGLDSGTKSAPISYTGDGRSRLLSGMKIPPSAWMPSAKNANVYAVDLLALGADPALFGSFLQPDNPGGVHACIHARTHQARTHARTQTHTHTHTHTHTGQTMGRCTSRQAELFYGGKPMTIARYPNRAPSGDFRWLNISSVQDAQATFQVADERVLAWSQEPDVWIHGMSTEGAGGGVATGVALAGRPHRRTRDMSSALMTYQNTDSPAPVCLAAHCSYSIIPRLLELRLGRLLRAS